MKKPSSELRRLVANSRVLRSGLLCAFGVILVGVSGGVGQRRDPGPDATRGLIARVQRLELTCAPVGTVVAYAGSVAPDGWLICDGSEIDPNEHPEYALLASRLGNNFDPAPQKIKLPDLRGRVVVGTGQGSGLTSRKIWEPFGEESHVMTTDEMPKHKHTGTTGPGNKAFHRFMHNPGGLGTGGNHDTGYGDGGFTDSTDDKYMMRNHTHDFVTSEEGGGKSFTNAQPSYALHYVIKY